MSKSNPAVPMPFPVAPQELTITPATPIAAGTNFVVFLTSCMGGTLLLHNLRPEVGDETFFTIARTFVERFSQGPATATSADFVTVAEAVAGRNLSTVWDTWLYGTTMPSQVTLLGCEVVDLTEQLGR